VLTALLCAALISCGDETSGNGEAGDTSDAGVTGDAADLSGDGGEPGDDPAVEAGVEPDASEPDAAGDLPPPPVYPLDDRLRVNHLQVRCTHNSYHIEPDFPVSNQHEYTHLSLDQQLGEQGVRAFELDLHDGDGFPIFHISFIDDQTTCDSFPECLSVIRRWSDGNRGHHIIFVWFEIKDELDLGSFSDYDGLDAMFLEAFPRDRILTPDDVQGEHDSIREALMTDGWPTLGETRDHIMFLMLERDNEHSRAYTEDHTTLEGRIAFVQADPDQFDLPWAAVTKLDNPADEENIAAAHERWILVASNTGAANGSYDGNHERRLAGLANGVHMLCDDIPGPIDGREYWLDMPGGTPSLCNPVSAPQECTSNDIEALAR
jgi:hypothetical protein